MNAEEYLKVRLSESEAKKRESVYDRLLKELKELSGKADIEALRRDIFNLIKVIFKKLSSEGESLLLYTSKFFGEDYIFAHSLNVCLLSMRLGQKLRIDREGLRTLGFLALTHAQDDMGFPRGLAEETGYTKEMGEIMRLADVYDALTNPPSYRHAMTPCETMESIIKSDEFFDRRLVKILIGELSLYPKDCWVQLSTKEIGKVIKPNPGLPLRPVVKVFIDWEGNYLKEGKVLDLSKNHRIHISRPLTEVEIKKIEDTYNLSD